jgi:hypothetical protein
MVGLKVVHLAILMELHLGKLNGSRLDHLMALVTATRLSFGAWLGSSDGNSLGLLEGAKDSKLEGE